MAFRYAPTDKNVSFISVIPRNGIVFTRIKFIKIDGERKFLPLQACLACLGFHPVPCALTIGAKSKSTASPHL
jgi:hypothetical protein